MGRQGILESDQSTFFNMEMLLNDLTRIALASATKRALAVAILDEDGNQISPGGALTGVTTNRQVTLNSAAAVKIEPTSGTREIQIFNSLSVSVRYGGSGVTTSTGGKLFSSGSVSFKVGDGFDIWLIPESGGDASVQIIELK